MELRMNGYQNPIYAMQKKFLMLGNLSLKTRNCEGKNFHFLGEVALQMIDTKTRTIDCFQGNSYQTTLELVPIDLGSGDPQL